MGQACERDTRGHELPYIAEPVPRRVDVEQREQSQRPPRTPDATAEQPAEECKDQKVEELPRPPETQKEESKAEPPPPSQPQPQQQQQPVEVPEVKVEMDEFQELVSEVVTKDVPDKVLTSTLM